MRDPADAALGRGGEQRLGWCAGARCAVLPEDSQPGGAVTGAGVVNVQRAPIAQRKVRLGHHGPSLTTSAGAVEPGPRLVPRTKRDRSQGRPRRQNANTASAPSTISQATRPPSQPSTAEAITRIASRTMARTGDGARIFALVTCGLTLIR